MQVGKKSPVYLDNGYPAILPLKVPDPFFVISLQDLIFMSPPEQLKQKQ